MTRSKKIGVSEVPAYRRHPENLAHSMCEFAHTKYV